MLVEWLLLMLFVHHLTANKLYIGQDFKPTKGDVRICTGMKMKSNITYHLTRFQPDVGRKIHHMVLLACIEPGTYHQYWNCGQTAVIEPGYHVNNYCKDPDVFWLYGWSSKSTKAGLSIPEGFSFQIGKDTEYKYLVLEVHYALPVLDQNSEEAKAGIYITYENKPISDTQIANVDIQRNFGHIIPSNKKTTVDLLGEVPVVMHPLMFHVHTHGLGVKVSGYFIKQETLDSDKPVWIKIGQRSPPMPQDYYPVENNTTMNAGDLVGVRCTYYNYRDHHVKLGPKDSDEMCEYSILYWTKRKNKLALHIDVDKIPWSQTGLKNIPVDA